MPPTRPRTLPSGFIPPCLPIKAPRPPAGAVWLHQIGQPVESILRISVLIDDILPFNPTQFPEGMNENVSQVGNGFTCGEAEPLPRAAMRPPRLPAA